MAHKPLVVGVSYGVCTLVLKELGFAWLGVLLLSIASAILSGSAIFSVGALAAAVLIGVPATIFRLIRRDSKNRILRRLAMILVLPMLTLAYVSHVDEQIPENATPLIEAIESFRLATGRYPESLEALIPKHLAQLPAVRFSVMQPQITYRVTDGKPYLAVPSAMGDMFAQFEFDFETKVWKHYS